MHLNSLETNVETSTSQYESDVDHFLSQVVIRVSVLNPTVS